MQYIIRKGTALSRGRRIEVKLRKFSATSHGMYAFTTWVLMSLLMPVFTYAIDSLFETVLYASNSIEIMRYTDEGEMKELCRCTVDLGVLPNYKQQVDAQPFGGFYTGACDIRTDSFCPALV